MSLKTLIGRIPWPVATGPALTALLGLLLYYIPAGQTLADLSYDWPMLFNEPGAFPEVELVEMDETSYQELHQDPRNWDRRLHAGLLDYLRADGAGVVVFDIVFADTGTNPEATRALARAIRDHGRVALGAGLEEGRAKGIATRRVIPPIDEFRDATTNWGPARVFRSGDRVVRQVYPGTEREASLTWVAAGVAGAPVARAGIDRLADRWIRYYGPGGTLPRLSYLAATNRAPGHFRGKTVFIGARPSTLYAMDEVEEFPSPWRWGGPNTISGLELTATQFLNLTRGDFLTRLPATGEMTLLTLLGILFGGGLAWLRPWRAALLAAVGWVAVVVLAFVLFFESHAWINWGVVALAQIPAALVWSLLCHWRKLKKEKDWLEAPLPDLWGEALGENPATPRSSGPTAAAGAGAMLAETLPAIPDHELLRPVGRGAYGDGWLARDALGNFHAVKIVRREAFEHADPYEREFRGLQKFTPVSRAHPGLVHILHAGCNDRAGCFYYVMEAGDDEQTGNKIDPRTYTPRNLARDLRRRGPLPLAECLDLGAALCEALEFLHRQGLIHRDIKPSNIIFVNGRPKLADIGLVTDIASSRAKMSNVGTEGYLPPEGPGTTAGDVYALGQVLRDMRQPRAVTGVASDAGDAPPEPSGAGWEQWRAIIRTACAENPGERFASAQAMREALLLVATAGMD